MDQITVTTTINARIDKVWELWTTPAHICQWNNASEDWHTPHAENDLRVRGRFLYRMEAKDGSFGFDFIGTYDDVQHHALTSYFLEDGRKVKVSFSTQDGVTKVIESFDPESENPSELQKGGWQAILDNFKKYVETDSFEL